MFSSNHHRFFIVRGYYSNKEVSFSFYSGWINLQVAGHALVYRPYVLHDLLEDEFPDFPILSSYEDAIMTDFDVQDVLDAAITVAYIYNDIYSDMEYEPSLDDEAMNELDAALADGELDEAEYELRRLEIYMDGLEDTMKYLADNNLEDRDVQLLREYLSALRALRERQQPRAATLE